MDEKNVILNFSDFYEELYRFIFVKIMVLKKYVKTLCDLKESLDSFKEIQVDKNFEHLDLSANNLIIEKDVEKYNLMHLLLEKFLETDSGGVINLLSYSEVGLADFLMYIIETPNAFIFEKDADSKVIEQLKDYLKFYNLLVKRSYLLAEAKNSKGKVSAVNSALQSVDSLDLINGSCTNES